MVSQQYPFFLTSVGFFAGLLFVIQTPLEPLDIVLVTMVSTVFMYLVGIGTMAFMTKHEDLQAGFDIRREVHEATLDRFIGDIEAKEVQVREIENFVREFELEEYKNYIAAGA